MAHLPRKNPIENGKYAIEQTWTDERKGLRKELILFKYQSLTKANDFSRCCVAISEIAGLTEHHDTEYLRDNTSDTEQWIKIADAITPIDYYIEIFLRRILIGETSRCFITTKSGVCISFVLKMICVEFAGYVYSKSLPDLIRQAQHYKENGVKMFKKYPLFAHDYFSKAAKCLISCQPFDTLKERELGIHEANPEALQEMLENILMNIAACLIKEKRFEETLHVLEFAERPINVPDKAVYRRANALYQLGQLDEAKTTLERINYKESKECQALYANIVEKWKVSNENYTKMVKKMFS